MQRLAIACLALFVAAIPAAIGLHGLVGDASFVQGLPLPPPRSSISTGEAPSVPPTPGPAADESIDDRPRGTDDRPRETDDRPRETDDRPRGTSEDEPSEDRGEAVSRDEPSSSGPGSDGSPGQSGGDSTSGSGGGSGGGHGGDAREAEHSSGHGPGD